MDTLSRQGRRLWTKEVVLPVQVEPGWRIVGGGAVIRHALQPRGEYHVCDRGVRLS